MRTRGLLVLSIVLLSGCAKEDADGPSGEGPTPYVLHIPPGLPPMPMPADNPLTVEGVRLGRYLFYEERLSGNDEMSCNTCHTHSSSFTDGVAVSTGIDGIDGTRSSMPLVDLGWHAFFFWDGRSTTLEHQVLEPVRNPIEMHSTWPEVMAKLQADPAYPPLFQAAFGTSTVDSVLVAGAIAQFLRTLISADSEFDRWQRGEGTLSPEAMAGHLLFTTEAGPVGEPVPLLGGGTVIGQGGADCFHCHPVGLFTDGAFHNNGLDTEFEDPGRAGVTGDPGDLGKFRTPTLRNIGLTRPYMHDGRFNSLDQVLAHYNAGGHATATTDPFMKFTDERTMELTAEQREQLKAFLLSLADFTFVNDPRFLDPGPP